MGHARTIWITVGADGKLDWPDGRLIVPSGFAGKVDGYAEGTVVEVHGSYERVDAHTKRLEIQRVKVAETPVERALGLWRRVSVLLRADDDPKTRPEWSSFVDSLHALRGDGSPTAIMLRAWRSDVEGDRPEAMRMFGEALTLDTLNAEHLVRALWVWTPDEVKDGWSPRQREELVRSVWRSPPGWNWVHPFVASLWSRPEHPLHFGGPRPDADEDALRAWICRLVLEIATPEEKKQIARIERLSEPQRRQLISGLRVQDQTRHDDAYTDMVGAWSADPNNDMDSPPDHVPVTWTEESRLLPARWCGLMSGSDEWDDQLEAAPWWVLGFWRERGRDADALAYLMDAACIVSALDPALVERLERVVFAHAGLTEGYALVLLQGGKACLLHAPKGPFGSWTHRVGDPESLADSLPDAELARLALKRGTLGWSMRTHRIPSHGEEVAEREGTPLPSRDEKPKLEPEKPRWVVHKRHGRGLVVGSIPGPKGPKLVIEFETAGRKTLLHSFVEDE